MAIMIFSPVSNPSNHPLVGKSYHTKQKDGYNSSTNDPTNNRTNWIWMSKKIRLYCEFSGFCFIITLLKNLKPYII